MPQESKSVGSGQFNENVVAVESDAMIEAKMVCESKARSGKETVVF